MGKRLSLAVALGALLGALWAAPAMAADALTSCIQSTTVCVADGASISDESAVTAALQGKAHVAVVSNDDSNSLNPNQLATQLAQSSSTKELILVVDMGSSDRFGVYSQSGKGDEILEALNGAGQADGGEAIVSSNVASIYSTPAAVSDSGGGGAWLLTGLIVILVTLGSFGTAYFFYRASRRGREKAIETGKPSRAAIAAQKSVVLSDEFRRELAEISKSIGRYEGSSNRHFQEATASLRLIQNHIYELFARLDRKKSRQDRDLAQVRYVSIFKKLNSTLSRDQFDDMVLHPDLWEKPEEMIAGVLTALRSVDRQIVENIKQVNSSKELEFRLAVDSLIGTEEIKVEDAFGDSDPDSGPEKLKLPFRR